MIDGPTSIMATVDFGSSKSNKSRKKEACDIRVERKRELDRLAQRATRERTKNRIAFLEQKLASLESCDRQGEITNLTKMIDDLRGDNMRLQGALSKMRFAINEALDGAEGVGTTSTSNLARTETVHSSSDSGTPRHESMSTADSDVIDLPTQPSPSIIPEAVPLSNSVRPPQMTSTTIAGTMNSLGDGFGMQMMHQMVPFYDQPSAEFMQYSMSAPSPFSFHMAMPTNTGITVAEDIQKWYVSNDAFISCIDSVKAQRASNQELDLHVPFKAAMFGWESVGNEAFHPVWAAIRRVDQEVFGTWTSKAQRVALMYVCQTLLQYRENPTKDNLARVPPWFRPRPAQEKVQHPAVIDFLVWPGLRDRLVFEHDKYTRTGDFSAAFVGNFNFDWPFGDEQIMSIDDQGRCHVSKTFLDYAYDFRNWTMRPEFFKQFPEMKHDIPEFKRANGMEAAAMGPFQHQTGWTPAM